MSDHIPGERMARNEPLPPRATPDLPHEPGAGHDLPVGHLPLAFAPHATSKLETAEFSPEWAGLP